MRTREEIISDINLLTDEMTDQQISFSVAVEGGVGNTPHVVIGGTSRVILYGLIECQRYALDKASNSDDNKGKEVV